jgi:two-component system, OmpR family, sensor histidine kinase VicK
MTTIDPAALRLAAIVESSDDAIISHDLNGAIETWNRAAYRIFGYSSDEAVGRSVDTLFASHDHTDHRQLIQRFREGDSIAHLQTTGLTKAGETIPVSLSISPVLTPRGEIIGVARIVRDLSAQHRAERDAFRLAAIVSSSEDAIISKDLMGIVQTWNSAAERMFGYSADEMIGESITRIIPADRYSEEETVLTRVRAGLPVEHFETVRQRKDGTLIDISLSVSPIRTPSGLVIGASKIARDVSTQRQLARAAEEANRVKDEFLATLSHELRTPLNAVLGYTRMLRAGRLGTERQERAIDVIERNATVLHQLVSDVLDVSGIVTGKMRINMVPCDVSDIVRAAWDSVRPASDTKGVPILVQAPNQPVIISCDPDRMQQVFWNLLANAVKFTPPGGQVSVNVRHGDGSASVSVTDTGVGLSPEALPHIFQRFWQGDSVNSRQTGGLGLGLALARHFVELHGGTISVASSGPGTGATFTVTMPLPDADRS